MSEEHEKASPRTVEIRDDAVVVMGDGREPNPVAIQQVNSEARLSIGYDDAPLADVERVIAAWKLKQQADEMAKAMFDQLATSAHVPFTDDGIKLLSVSVEQVIADMPEEHKDYLKRVGEQMTREDWAAFAAAAVRPVRPEDLLVDETRVQPSKKCPKCCTSMTLAAQPPDIWWCSYCNHDEVAEGSGM